MNSNFDIEKIFTRIEEKLGSIEERLNSVDGQLVNQANNFKKISKELEKFHDESDMSFRNLKNSVRSVENDSFALQSKLNQLHINNNINNNDGIKYIYSASSEANSVSNPDILD